MTINRRSAYRYDVVVPAHLWAGEQKYETTIQNLSLGGAQLVTTGRLALGQRVRLSFQLPARADMVEVHATVRWSDAVSAGLQFESLRPKDVWLLNQYFATLTRSES